MRLLILARRLAEGLGNQAAQTLMARQAKHIIDPTLHAPTHELVPLSPRKVIRTPGQHYRICPTMRAISRRLPAEASMCALRQANAYLRDRIGAGVEVQKTHVGDGLLWAAAIHLHGTYGIYSEQNGSARRGAGAGEGDADDVRLEAHRVETGDPQPSKAKADKLLPIQF